jgi:hypothetical protein
MTVENGRKGSMVLPTEEFRSAGRPDSRGGSFVARQEEKSAFSDQSTAFEEATVDEAMMEASLMLAPSVF